MNLWHKICNRWTRLCLQPIRVFCLHEISAKPEFSNEGPSDWMDINVFKRKIENMRKRGYVFISLEDAYRKIQTDRLRFRKYAVLTNDDGRISLREILPWLIEQKLPITLFINGNYTDGKEYVVAGFNPFHCLTFAELKHYVEASYGLISIQSHGYEHLDATTMSPDAFREQIEKNMSLSSLFSYRLPLMGKPTEGACFHAYTWGRHNAQTDAILKENNIIPVLMDGMKNYNDASCIHRELLENYDK